MNADRKAVLQAKCKNDLKFLAKEVLGMTKWEDSLHDDLAKFLKESGPRKGVLIPRGHLKSSIVTVAYSIQQILINPNIRILIRNAVWDIAREFLSQIQAYLIDASALPQIFGQFVSKDRAWTTDEIEIAQKVDFTKRGSTILTRGIESTVTGLHFDLIIDDDLVGEQNVTTREQIDKIKKMFNDSVNLLDSRGRHLVVGTRWAMGDLYGKLLEEETRSVNGVLLKTKNGWREALAEWKERFYEHRKKEKEEVLTIPQSLPA